MDPDLTRTAVTAIEEKVPLYTYIVYRTGFLAPDVIAKF
jgi:hypothetical protein